MNIDRSRALAVLEEEAKKASIADASGPWAERIKALDEATGDGNKTFIAMVGTALLAKATNLEADPFALQVGEGQKGAYSARSLCQHVLAAHAPRLGIDIGVTGREPLNNQPFFAKPRVTKDLPVKRGAKKALLCLLEYLKAIDAIRREALARKALRAFLQVRKRASVLHELGDRDFAWTLEEFISFVESFVSASSESGKRAQAVAAGLIDVFVGPDRVRVARVHDPDQRFPGDIGVQTTDNPDVLERCFEVRDKPVAETDLYHFAQKAAQHNVDKAAMLAVSARQEILVIRDVYIWSEQEGVHLAVYFGWKPLLFELIFWSSVPFIDALKIAYRRVFVRLTEIEASEAAMLEWAQTPGPTI
jgi:hypothetical protein